ADPCVTEPSVFAFIQPIIGVRHNTNSSLTAAAGLSSIDRFCSTDASFCRDSSPVVSATDSLVAARILPRAA
ncbi:hypothetical protein A2U01_0086087, partial [Trifolium medium]|nr:hypothetical protein [Trifolium medium]